MSSREFSTWCVYMKKHPRSEVPLHALTAGAWLSTLELSRQRELEAQDPRMRALELEAKLTAYAMAAPGGLTTEPAPGGVRPPAGPV